MKKTACKYALVVSTAVAVGGCGGAGRMAGAGEARELSPAISHQVTLRLNGNRPLLAAFQDGVRPWTAVTVSGDSINMPVTDTAGRYGFMVVEPGSKDRVIVIQSTVAEATLFDLRAPTVLVSLQGAVSGLAKNESMSLFALNAQNPNTLNGHYTFPIPRQAPWDLVAARQTTQGTQLVQVRRGLLANTLQQDLPATSVAFRTPALFNVQLTEAAAPSASFAFVSLITANGTFADLGGLPNQSSSYFALNQLDRAGADRYLFDALTFGDATSVQMLTYENVPTNRSLIAPEPLPAATFATAPTAKSHVARVTWATDPRAKLFDFTFDSNRAAASHSEYVTKNRLLAGTVKTFTTPDFSTVTGWNTSWDAPATLTKAEIDSYASTLTLHDLIALPATFPNHTVTTIWSAPLPGRGPAVQIAPGMPDAGLTAP